MSRSQEPHPFDPEVVRRCREDLLAIWQAGLDGVGVQQLMREHLVFADGGLSIARSAYPLAGDARLVVVGAGKASGRMAAALETLLDEAVASNGFQPPRIEGWINVPDDCAPPAVPPLRDIVLHGARPAGVNEPTEAGVEGTRHIVRLVETLRPQDLALCLISGGGSALLPAPIEGVSLAEKQELVRFLTANGANIGEINIVRKQLSRVKGGGLARRCPGRLVTLILSDIPGDPLDLIASGPTVPDPHTPAEALDILRRYAVPLPNLYTVLERAAERRGDKVSSVSAASSATVRNVLIGNNATAVDAAGTEAVRRGYSPVMVSATECEGEVGDLARHLLDVAQDMLERSRSQRPTAPDCFLSGGEPVVRLAPEAQRGLGGRNQQLVLAVLVALLESGGLRDNDHPGFAMLSCGTDGEDGPTDAAGAFFDAEILAKTLAALRRSELDPRDFLLRNDAYHFFEQVGGLVKTGPTGTNVCDLRIILRECPRHKS